MTRHPSPREWEAIDDVMRREMPWWDRDGSEVEPLAESSEWDSGHLASIAFAVLLLLVAVAASVYQ